MALCTTFPFTLTWSSSETLVPINGTSPFIFTLPCSINLSAALLEQKPISDKNLFDKLITNQINSGKGFAVKKGLEIANAKYIIFQDADLEYDPGEFIKFFNEDKKDIDLSQDGSVSSLQNILVTNEIDTVICLAAIKRQDGDSKEIFSANMILVDPEAYSLPIVESIVFFCSILASFWSTITLKPL